LSAFYLQLAIRAFVQVLLRLLPSSPAGSHLEPPEPGHQVALSAEGHVGGCHAIPNRHVRESPGTGAPGLELDAAELVEKERKNRKKKDGI
jgi:hypothetical protein